MCLLNLQCAKQKIRERDKIKKKINTVINETHWVCRESMKYALRNRTTNQKQKYGTYMSM